jgi:hypothetical protein
MIADIALDDALILPHRANPTGLNFRERHLSSGASIGLCLLAARAAPRKAKPGYDIHPGEPTGREVQAMHRLQVLTERYIGEGLTPADARTRATEELRANPRRDY